MIHKGFIYCATSPSGKKYYGFTNDFIKRKYQHKIFSSVKKNVFYDAIKKYGFESFIWEVIESYENDNKKIIKEILRKREIFWIEKGKTYLSEFGYNMTHGGDGGDTQLNRSDEDKKKTTEKRSKAYLGENNPMFGRTVYDIWVEKYGKEIADIKRLESSVKRSRARMGISFPCSEEKKERISKTLTGHKISEEQRLKRIGTQNACGKRSEESKERMRKPKSKEHVEKLREIWQQKRKQH